MKIIFAGLFIISICLGLDASAQTKPAGEVSQLIECSIQFEGNTLLPGRPATVSVAVKNVSKKSLDVLGTYSFRLVKENDTEAAKHGREPAEYWSPVDILKGTQLKLQVESEPLKKGIVVGRVPSATVHLEEGESKEFKFDLGQLFWNRSIYSGWPSESLFDVVPEGSYRLKFRILTDRGVSRDGGSTFKSVYSNEIQVTVERKRNKRIQAAQ